MALQNKNSKFGIRTAMVVMFLAFIVDKSLRTPYYIWVSNYCCGDHRILKPSYGRTTVCESFFNTLFTPLQVLYNKINSNTTLSDTTIQNANPFVIFEHEAILLGFVLLTIFSLIAIYYCVQSILNREDTLYSAIGICIVACCSLLIHEMLPLLLLVSVVLYLERKRKLLDITLNVGNAKF